MFNRKLIVVPLALIALVGVTAGSCLGDTHQDAPSGTVDDKKADVINMPDGFRNVAFKCNGPNMIYVTSAGADDSQPSGIFVVVNDPRCAKTAG